MKLQGGGSPVEEHSDDRKEVIEEVRTQMGGEASSLEGALKCSQGGGGLWSWRFIRLV